MWGCILCLVNHLLRFPLTSEHDDSPDALEGAVQMARASKQAGARPFLVGEAGIEKNIRIFTEGIYVNDLGRRQSSVRGIKKGA